MSLDYHWHDLLGNLGVILIVGSYFWMQIVNAIGAALVLVSLYFDFNLSAALVESFWLVISILGLLLGLREARMRNSRVAWKIKDSGE
jgi:hypothetical protein